MNQSENCFQTNGGLQKFFRFSFKYIYSKQQWCEIVFEFNFDETKFSLLSSINIGTENIESNKLNVVTSYTQIIIYLQKFCYKFSAMEDLRLMNTKTRSKFLGHNRFFASFLPSKIVQISKFNLHSMHVILNNRFIHFLSSNTSY